MENYNNRKISISGDPASGKGSVTTELKRLYESQGIKVTVISVGTVFREIVQKEYAKKFPNAKATSLEAICKDPNFAEDLKNIDIKIDNEVKRRGEQFDSIERPNEIAIFEGRVCFDMIPNTFAVKLTVDSETAGERVYKDSKRGPEDQHSSREEAIASTESRKQAEIERFKKTYGVDLTDDNNFGLIIGTTLATIEDVAKTIQICEELYRQGKPFAKTWASPELFYPTQSLAQTDERYVWRLNEEERKKNPNIFPFATTEQLKIQYPEMKITYKTKQVGQWTKAIYDLQDFAHMIQENGIYPDEPITSTTRGNSIYQFVEDGHHRVFGSIIAGKTLIPYKIIGHTDKETVNFLTRKYICEHDIIRFDGSKFRFENIPELEKNVSKTQINEQLER